MATIKISQLGNATTITGNVILPLVANVSGTLTTLQGNVDQVKTYIIGTLATDVANLTANAGSQDSNISSLQSNVSTLQSNVANLQSNVATIEANVAVQYNLISNVTNGTATFGNLVPGANVTYSLGSSSAQWKDLYLSGSTIYLGGAEISVVSGNIQTTLPIAADITANTLSVADTQITFSQGSYIDETEVVGQPGTYGLALNSPNDGIVGLNAIDANADVTSSVIVSNISAQINVAGFNYGDPPFTWLYAQGGAIVWPDDSQQDTAFSQAYIDEITNATANVANLQSDLANVQSDLANIDLSPIANIEANVTAITSDLANLTANVTTIEGNITTLEGNITTLEGNITTLEGNITTLEGNITTLEGNITSIDGSITLVNANVANIVNGTTALANVIPGANIVYNLGSTNFRWNDAYIQNTLYINDANLTSNGDRIFTSGGLSVAAGIELPFGGVLNGITALAGNAAVLLAPSNGAAAISSVSGNISIFNTVEITETFANVTIHNANTAVTHTWQFTEDGNLSLPSNGYVNGSVSFTMANATHWTTPVYSIEDAINQLAERIYNIENP